MEDEGDDLVEDDPGHDPEDDDGEKGGVENAAEEVQTFQHEKSQNRQRYADQKSERLPSSFVIHN